MLLAYLWSKNFFYKISPICSKWLKLIFKTGNGIIQTGNGTISPTSRLLIKNILYTMFLIWSMGFKINFQNRKWNYPNRKWNYPNRKWNYFSYFQASDEKTSLTKRRSFDPRASKLIFKTGNGIIQTGNGIISPTSRPLMKKLL